MTLRFSQRIGKTSSIKPLQLESVDEELKNALWNILKLYALDTLTKGNYSNRTSSFYNFTQVLWHEFYKLPIDELNHNDHYNEKIIREKFFGGEWFEIYDLLEFIASLGGLFETDEFVEAINIVLEREFAGYRFISGKIAPISNDIELGQIHDAVNINQNYTALNGANIHLSNAITKLSYRNNPDYRNSIKESISALETMLRVISGESTFGKALNALQNKGVVLDEQLRNGYEKIYAYTNNKQSGIRHAIVEDHQNPTFEEAKFILLLSSALINYLMSKVKEINLIN